MMVMWICILRFIPYGSFNNDTLELLGKTGYRKVFSSSELLYNKITNRIIYYGTPRFNMDNETIKKYID